VQVLDSSQQGAGQLIQQTVQSARAVQSGISFIVHGDQVVDPVSIAFLSSVGIDFVVCRPTSVPAVRLAAAHASIATDVDIT
jgi:phosphoenolpyruvate synthase/pyruvate phosphate dikinase